MRRQRRQITDSVQIRADEVVRQRRSRAQQYPQYAKQIIAGGEVVLPDGADWAYVAGIVAILLGAAVVFFLFPTKGAEEHLLARYHSEDTAEAA